jgi:hypothetical protein
VARFGARDFDFLILAYDDTRFDEPVFAPCEVVRAPGMKWELLRAHLPPERAAPYAWVFAWDDDLDARGFDPHAFLDVMRRNGLELAQPALTRDSHASHPLTLQADAKVGRFTDFVEIMAPVFRADAWARFHRLLDPQLSRWGWGLDLYAQNLCGFERMGIVDCQTVRHTRPLNPGRGQREELRRFRRRHPGARAARKLAYAELG